MEGMNRIVEIELQVQVQVQIQVQVQTLTFKIEEAAADITKRQTKMKKKNTVARLRTSSKLSTKGILPICQSQQSVVGTNNSDALKKHKYEYVRSLVSHESELDAGFSSVEKLGISPFCKCIRKDKREMTWTKQDGRMFEVRQKYCLRNV